MSVSGRVRATAREIALSAGLGIVVLAFAAAGVGFLVAAVFVLLRQRLGLVDGAVLMGGGLLVVALLVGLAGSAWLRRVRRAQPGVFAELGGTVGLATQLLGMMVRRDPKKAIILATVFGAVTEYLLGDTRK